MRELTRAEFEIGLKIEQLQLFVNERLKDGRIPDLSKGQALIDDIQLLRHIWTKEDGSI